MQLGKLDEARAALEQAIEIAHTNEDLCQISELHRLRGELLTLDGSPLAAAEAEFHLALEKAREQSSRSWELRATISLANLYRKTGRSGNGRRILSNAYRGFTEGFDTGDLRAAKTLLDQLV